jgi:hypothetical protein
MTNFTHLEMHQDHQHWLGDASLWFDEIELWKQGSQAALDDLVRLEKTLRGTVQAIERHEHAVREHVQTIKRHEHAVGDFEKSGAGDDIHLLGLAKRHKDESSTHAQMRQAHERQKKAFYTLMAHWDALLKQVAKPM